MKRVTPVLLLVVSLLVGMMGISFAEEPPRELGECERWIETTYKEVVDQEARTEIIEHPAKSERVWFNWTGGPTDSAPDIDSDGWHATSGSPEGQPHQQPDDTPYQVGGGNADWSMWRTVVVEDGWTEMIEHEATYKTVVDTPGFVEEIPNCPDTTPEPEIPSPEPETPSPEPEPEVMEPVDPVYDFYAVHGEHCDETTGVVEVLVFFENQSRDGTDEEGNPVEIGDVGFEVFVDGEELYNAPLSPGESDSVAFWVAPDEQSELVVNALDTPLIHETVPNEYCETVVSEVPPTIEREVEEEETEEPVVSVVTVEATPVADTLPETGGNNTTAYLLLGMLLLAAGVLMLHKTPKVVHIN